jgi:WD40 repeat protein
MLATSGNELRLWNLNDSSSSSLEIVREFSASNRFAIKCGDSIQIASCSDKSGISLINLDNYSKDLTTESTRIDLKETQFAKCCSFDSSGRNLVVGYATGAIDVFDFKSQTQKRKSFNMHAAAPAMDHDGGAAGGQVSFGINCIGWSKNDRYIATGNSNGTIILFNTVLTQMLKPWSFSYSTTKSSSSSSQVTTTTAAAAVTALNYSSLNASLLAAAYDQGSVTIWDANKEQITLHHRSHELAATCVSLSPVSAILMVSAGLDGQVILYDLKSKKPIKHIPVAKSGVSSLDFNRDGATLCVGCIDGQVQIFDLRAEQMFKSFKAHDSSVNCCKFLQKSLTPLLTPQSVVSSSSSSSSSCYEQSLASSSSLRDQSSHLGASNGGFYSPLSLPPSTTAGPTSTSTTTTIKKSNSYSNSNLAALTIVNSNVTNFDMFSPEKLPSNKTNSDSGSESFILHKRPAQDSTSNLIINGQTTSVSSIMPPQREDQRKDLNDFVIQQVKSSTTIKQTLVSNDKAAAANGLYSPIANSTNITQTQPVTATATVATATAANSTCTNLLDLSSSQQLKDLIRLEVQRVQWNMEDNHDRIMSESYKFKCEMLKEFIELKSELTASIRDHSINESLIAEILKLKEQNKRLKKLF